MNGKILNIELMIGVILCFIGGFIEIYSLKIFNAFSGMQTGNLIYTFTYLIDNNYQMSLFHFSLIFAFLIGIIFTEIIINFARKKHFEYRYFIYFFNILLLISVIFLAKSNNNVLSSCNMISALLLSLFSGIQSHAFTSINNHALSTTMMTAMMKMTTANFYNYFKTKNKSYLFEAIEVLIIILFFILGFAMFYLIYKVINKDYLNLSLLLIIFLIIILIILTFYKNKNIVYK